MLVAGLREAGGAETESCQHHYGCINVSFIAMTSHNKTSSLELRTVAWVQLTFLQSLQSDIQLICLQTKQNPVLDLEY